MLAQSSRRSFQRRLLCLSALPLVLLAACGGDADDNSQSADLDDAYEAIGAGMSYTHVRSIVGADPVSQIGDGEGITIYRWEMDRGTYLFSALTVRIDAKVGVLNKSVTGSNESKTESFESA